MYRNFELSDIYSQLFCTDSVKYKRDGQTERGQRQTGIRQMNETLKKKKHYKHFKVKIISNL